MNSNLKKVLRVLKKRGLFATTSKAELARLSGLSRKTISQNSDKIKSYTLTAPEPSESDNDFVNRKLLPSYIKEAIKQAQQDGEEFVFAYIIGAITGFVLRHETDLINNIQQTRKIVKVGHAVSKLTTQIQSRKEDKGTSIHSKSKHAQYLLTEMNRVGFMDELFTRSDNYKTGYYSKEWKLQNSAKDLIDRVIELSIPIIKEEAASSKVTVMPAQMKNSLCSGESVTCKRLLPELTFFDVDIDTLTSLSASSIIQLVSKAVPSLVDNALSISLQNNSSTDPNLGRTYNVFTSLSSEERKALGYINYDISSGIQIISFGLLYRYGSSMYRTAEDLFESYPMIFKYGWEPHYKRELRETIAKDLNISVDEVKQLLTAYANGSQKSTDGSEALAQFQEESDQLRRDVTALIAQKESQVLEAAINQSKHEFPDDLDWKSNELEEGPELARRKSSVFFFIWTHYEKQIRDAMLSVVDDGIPLHDAIYSKHDLPCEDFEKAVYDKTGFQVKISH
jgi:DNA-binding transcriptional MerR regulator